MVRVLVVKRLYIVSLFLLSSLGISCIFNGGSDSEKFYALDFDGVDDAVIVLNSDLGLDNIANKVTIECWIYPRSIPNRAPRILDRSDNILGPGGDRFVLSLFQPDSAARMNINGTGISSAQVPLNQWSHIACAYDGEQLQIYLNGVMSNSITTSSMLDVKDSLLYIGNDRSLTARQFDGYLDEIRIWNIARSQKQIQSNMNRVLTGNEEGLVAYWRMDEGQGGRAFDSAGDNDGQLGLQDSLGAHAPRWIQVDFPHVNLP